MAAGPLPSTTQATEGDGLLGSWGAAKTAPSGLSAAVTRSAEKGRGIGDPACKGPEVDTGGSVDPGVAVVDVVDVGVTPPGPVVVVVAACGAEDPELHEASTSAATAASAAAPAGNPNCRRGQGFPGMRASMACDRRGTAARRYVAALRLRAPGCQRQARLVGEAHELWGERREAGYRSAMATTREISYQADGRTMVGTLVLPDGTDRRPGVLVSHEGPGLDDHARSRAVRLADELGYVAFALDYHGGGQPMADRGQMMARLGEFREDPQRARAIATAGLDILRDQSRTDRDRLAAIGYCFGGTLSLELARGGADLKAVVGFHSGLAPARPEDARNIRARVLMLIGADDPIVDNAQRRDFEEEMRAGGVDWQLYVYGGAVHSFTNPRATGLDMPGIAYDERTDRRSWQAMLDLFDEVFG
jgi:dienelactone hydrolase